MELSPDFDDVRDLPDLSVSVSEFVDLVNETYEFAFPSIVISGELANLRVSKNRWVYFDLKDETASVKFFGTVQHLPGPLENGMLLNVRGTPHMHELYGFSVNVQLIQPTGEGSIRRAAELLAAKLQAEGLFDEARKRQLPYPPQHIGLITSAQSAAYADFIKILAARWGGLQIDLIDVQVQGEPAPQQICNALAAFNGLAQPPEVVVLIRGGGSADDLAAWSTEQVTRAVATSRLPTLVAIGHEVDVSLAELAADKRASTPSNAAEMLSPDKQAVRETLAVAVEALYDRVGDQIYEARSGLVDAHENLYQLVSRQVADQKLRYQTAAGLLRALSPDAALRRGYAIIRSSSGRVMSGQSANNTLKVDDIVRIEMFQSVVEARITTISDTLGSKPEVTPAIKRTKD